MAEAAVQRGQPRVRNQVHDDAIWRQTTNYELSTAKNWNENWGFMRELYKYQEANSKSNVKLPPLSSTTPRPYISGLPSKLPQGLTTDPKSYTADLLCIHDVPRIIRSRYPRQKYIYPATTQHEIGWGWERDEAEEAGLGIGKGFKADQSKTGDPNKMIPCEKSGLEYIQRRLVADANPTPIKFRTLEKFGRFARGKEDVLKWWGGSRESLP
ncbi:hypothetical protein SpCBS45565_g04467 [Spizellomyces sp. 'palustris']|nr:hypothetical protein SpCBS45565_g04467 [Spizellomyces sp. 'palustris']